MLIFLMILHIIAVVLFPLIVFTFTIPPTNQIYPYRWWFRGGWLFYCILIFFIPSVSKTIINQQNGKPQTGLEHRTLLLDGHPIDVEIAKTDAEKDIGLMYRTSLDAGHGMLFVWKQPSYQHFWMKDTLIPLDILFFDSQGKLIGISPQTPICKKDPCPIYDGNTSKMSQFVLELQSGAAKKLELKVGQTHMVIQKETFPARL